MASPGAPTATATAPHVTLRAATPADVPFLDEVYASTRASEVAALGWAPEATRSFLQMQADLQRRSFRAAWPDAAEQVVLLDGEPGGRLVVDRSGSAVALLDVVLLPEHRGRGIGRQLIHGVQAEASHEGLPVHLHVDHGNPARRLYERLGFVEVGRDQFRSAMAWGADAADGRDDAHARDPSALDGADASDDRHGPEPAR